MTLEPGAGQGGTRVVVHNQPQKRWRLGAGLTNSGQASTGRNKAQVTGELGGVLSARGTWERGLDAGHAKPDADDLPKDSPHA